MFEFIFLTRNFQFCTFPFILYGIRIDRACSVKISARAPKCLEIGRRWALTSSGIGLNQVSSFNNSDFHDFLIKISLILTGLGLRKEFKRETCKLLCVTQFRVAAQLHSSIENRTMYLRPPHNSRTSRSQNNFQIMNFTNATASLLAAVGLLAAGEQVAVVAEVRLGLLCRFGY